jgi:hypothetical protein
VRFTFFLKKEKRNLFFLFIIFIFLTGFALGDTPTSLNIPNAPPRLIMNIPDQNWPENESNLNAFDLDDYFEDPEGNTLSYYNSSVDDIYVYIDPITNEVSFFPDSGFFGVRNVTFYASDGFYDSLSNEVTLYVGLDETPPQWFNPTLDKTIIYQNDIVNFFTNWTDNRGLDRYIFSINQGIGWQNYSSEEFSGLENFSYHSVQIMAPGLNTVYWRFYAFDTSDNMNVTDIQSFVVSVPEAPAGEGGGGGGGEEGEGILSGLFARLEIQTRKAESFQLSLSEIKVSLKQGTSVTRVLKITNTGLEEIIINISSGRISDFTTLSETEFSILPGKSKEITIDFSAQERTIPGQYFGYIIVQSPKVKKTIPTVLDIKAIDLEFDLILNLSERYELVKPGRDVKANITLVSLKDLRQINASLYYAIKDYNGIVYNFSEEQVTFFSTLVLDRSLQVPETTPEGKYLLYARASDDKNIAIDSVGFEVGTRFNFSSFFKIGSISLLVLIFAILLAAFMTKYKRDKRKERLLELYVMLNKLKNLIKENKEEEALKLFIKIKDIYHEPIPKEIFDDKEKFKQEISELYDTFTKESKEIIKDNDINKTGNQIKETKKGLKDTNLKNKGEK